MTQFLIYQLAITRISMAKSAKIQAVITDWCGTVESNVYHRITVIKEACRASGLPEPSMSDCQMISGMSAQDAESFLRRPTWSSTQCQLLSDHLTQMMTADTHALILQRRTISWLEDRGISLSLFTNSTRPVVDSNLAKYQLTDCFRYIATSDVFPAKPKPDMLLSIQQSLNLPADSCLVVGDHINDCLAANQAGMPCVITLTGILSEAEFEEINPQPLRYCTDINELPKVIQDIQDQSTPE